MPTAATYAYWYPFLEFDLQILLTDVWILLADLLHRLILGLFDLNFQSSVGVVMESTFPFWPDKTHASRHNSVL